MEVWKPAKYTQINGTVLDLSFKLEVSDAGNVRWIDGAVLTGPYKEVPSQHPNPLRRADGSIWQRNVPCIRLYINGTRKRFFISRMVMSTFKPHNTSGLNVGHWNGVKHDNDLSNLYWFGYTDGDDRTWYLQ